MKALTTTTEKYLKLSSEQDNYIRIYHAYFVLQWEHFELQKHFKASPATISKAIRWVIDNKIKFPAEHLVEGAIYAIRERLRINKSLLDDELDKTKFRDKKFIIELNNQLRFDEERLFKLQQITDPSNTTGDAIKASDVLRLIVNIQKASN